LQVVSGAENVQFVAPNKFIYSLPRLYLSGQNDKVSLKSLRLYYSWFNMSTAKNNTQFSYIWVDGSEHSVVLPDGMWDYGAFQNYLEQVLIDRGHFLLDAENRLFRFIEIVANSSIYRISLVIRPVPAVLPDGWNAPAGFVFPAVDTTPQLIVPQTNITQYLGFSAGTYPAAPQTVIFQMNGQNVPQVTDITSLQIQTNIVSNDFGPDHRTLHTFNVSQDTLPGAMLSEVPFYPDWIPIQPSSRFNYVELELVDQLSRPVQIEDPSGFICTLNLD
jgi:hypothetical protein